MDKATALEIWEPFECNESELWQLFRPLTTFANSSNEPIWTGCMLYTLHHSLKVSADAKQNWQTGTCNCPSKDIFVASRSNVCAWQHRSTNGAPQQSLNRVGPNIMATQVRQSIHNKEGKNTLKVNDHDWTIYVYNTLLNQIKNIGRRGKKRRKKNATYILINVKSCQHFRPWRIGNRWHLCTIFTLSHFVQSFQHCLAEVGDPQALPCCVMHNHCACML